MPEHGSEDEVEELEVCPECDAADIRNRNPSNPASGSDSDAEYRCGTCREKFDEPARREPVSSAGPGAGGELTSKLAGMDPDDLATDGGEDQLVADGGETHLRFAHENVGFVLDGEEDATVRYDFERDLDAGDTVELLTPSGNVFALAEVKDVVKCELRHAHFDMTAALGRAHPSTSTMDLQKRLNRHYPEVAEVGLEEEVTVICFAVQQLGADSE